MIAFVLASRRGRGANNKLRFPRACVCCIAGRRGTNNKLRFVVRAFLCYISTRPWCAERGGGWKNTGGFLDAARGGGTRGSAQEGQAGERPPVECCVGLSVGSHASCRQVADF